MKTLTELLIAILIGLASLQGQDTVEAQRTTMCDLYQHPDQFSGKFVVVRARVAGNDLWIDEFTREPCQAWTKVILMVPANRDELTRDKNFQMFFDELRKGHGVEATFEGQFDAVFTWKDKKRSFVSTERKGYGKKHDAGARIVLHQVSEIKTLLGSRK